MSISSTSASSNSSGPGPSVPNKPQGDPETGAPKPSGSPRSPGGSRPGPGLPSLPKLGDFNLESLKDKVDLQALKEEAESKFQEMMGDNSGAGVQKMLAGLMSNFGG